MRIDPAGKNSPNGHYGIPAGNPFVNEKDPLTIKEIYAYGFRNPHRMAGTRQWKQDVVNRYWRINIEELNILRRAAIMAGRSGKVIMESIR
jgi:hypothetical protein